MEEEMRAYLDSMESRLMTRLKDSQERLLERLRGLETSITVLTEMARSTNVMLSTITALLSDLGRRITDLEKKP
jgi:hypothetical protein